MRTDEEEFLIQSIRCGIVTKDDLVIVPPTMDLLRKGCQVYTEAYDNAMGNDIMTDEGLERWMVEQKLLQSNFYTRKDDLVKKLDQSKVTLFDNRNDKKATKESRIRVEQVKNLIQDLFAPKSDFTQHTCEFIAQTARLIYILKRTTYKNKKRYRSERYDDIVGLWHSSLLSESIIRHLARTQHWKGIWNNKGHGFSLFKTRKNTDLTFNQKNLLTWANLYDNIQESMDCPSEDVMADDDMLDGWFIKQNNKRKKERAESEAESLMSKSGKMDNASHVFIPANQDGLDIDVLNNGIPVPDLETSLRKAASQT